MTKEEARKVCGVMLGADNGCPVCVRSLLRDFCKVFPAFKDIAETVWANEREDEAALNAIRFEGDDL